MLATPSIGLRHLRPLRARQAHPAITMSSCEAELIALADLAIESLHIIEVVVFLGHEVSEPIEVSTDSKAAYDLCHRFTSVPKTELRDVRESPHEGTAGTSRS